ncbi:unnamed protein product [Toxocara canis]|uniref:Fucosyltransferase n=1 Tax=Toxocara canis TaxID=6265 RepID=A0A183TZ02_TOXCA|nr:unnamed protein product [Toxocara canis]
MPRRPRRFLLIVLTAVIGVVVLSLCSNLLLDVGHSLVQEHNRHDSSGDGDEFVYRKKEVRLFVGTPFFRTPVGNAYLDNCSVRKHCKIVDDKDSSDAVLYHAPDFVLMGTLKPNQITVLWSLESPINHRFYQNFERQINWTMTYRRDADVWFPYGVITKRREPIRVDFDELWKSKKKMVVWLISNCGHTNGRIELTKALQEAGLEVDIFGACGRRPTPNDCDGVNKQGDRCVAELFKPYMFAISFENSLCKDYITEKFFEVLEKRYAVPIVMQRKTYEENGAPSDSFIAVDDYQNVDNLVNNLKVIAKDKSAYLKYHQWRETFEVRSDYFNIDDTGFCQLCKKIMRQDFMPKHYDDVASWHSVGICDQPQDGFVNKFLTNSGKKPSFQGD